MARLLVLANEATAAQRRVYFHLVDATDGLTAETGEAGGQPQVSSDGAAWTNTGIGTLNAIGNGRYYADLTQTLVQTAGTLIETRYKSANTAECPGDSVQVVAFDPNDAMRLGLTALPNALPDNAGGLPVSDAGGLDMDGIRADVAAILVDTGTTLDARIPSALGANGNMKADVRDYSGTAGTFSAGRPEVNTSHWGGTAVASALVRGNVIQWTGTNVETPDTAGVPNVNMVYLNNNGATVDNIGNVFGTDFATNYDDTNNRWLVDVRMISGDATAADNAEAFFDGTGYAGTNNVIPLVTTTTNVTTVNGLAAAAEDQIAVVVDTEIEAYGLQYLLDAAVTGTNIADNSIIAKLVSKSATADWDTFNNTTEALEALRDRGDAAWITATGFSTHTAADVWAVATRVLTAATNITSTGGTTVPQTGDSFALIGATGSGLTSLASAANLSTANTNISSILDDTGTSGVAIATATMQSIADETLKRGVAGVEDTANTTSLAAIILAILESSVSGTTWTIRKTGGTTFVTKTITTDAAADPITGVT